jgi:nicotinate (nicotinamide) nucleotide adenylyltransferase
MRVGVFGGTFDPVHRMHLVIAGEVLRVMEFDRILFVPVGASSHRDPACVTPARDRCAMIAAAIRDEPGFALCRVDVARPRRTYTVDTVADLRAQHGPDTELFLIVGADTLSQVPTWRRGAELMRTTRFVGVSRVGYRLADPGFPPGGLTLVHVPPLRSSASSIRSRVARGLPLDDLVPDEVRQYINDHSLYRPGRAAGSADAMLGPAGAPIAAVGPSLGDAAHATGEGGRPMQEPDWLYLARRAIEDLDGIPLDEQARPEVRLALQEALRLPRSSATARIREVLSSDPFLRHWLDDRLAQYETAGEGREDLHLRHGRDEVFRPDAPAPPSGPQEVEPRARMWRADIDDHEPSTPLEVGADCVVLISVDTTAAGALATDRFLEDALFDDVSADTVTLTVQLSSDDVDVHGPPVTELVLPRTGRTPSPARFVISPRRRGPCTLTFAVHLSGNFVTLLHLTVWAGDTGPATLASVGRPPDALQHLEPRDMMLVLQRSPRGGYECIPKAGGVQSPTVGLPVTTEELAAEVDHVQRALMNVVSLRDDMGQLLFQTGVQIPSALEQVALTTLARAGGRLFRKLFFHDQGGQDAAELGTYLRTEASDDGSILTLQVIDTEAAVPWALLYLGDVGDDATLDWQHFLGLRHIVELVPLGPLMPGRSPRIPSTPQLMVGLNVNLRVGPEVVNEEVESHQVHWQDLQSRRPGLRLTTRSTRSTVLDALKDPTNSDQIVYFYCHATAQGRDGDTGAAAITMEPDNPLTLDDLADNAGRRIPLSHHPLVFINACESADLSPLFYTGFVPYFLGRGARGVIGTECKTPALFAIRFAEAFFDRVLDGAPIGQAMLETRREFLDRYRNPLGLVYAVHCDVSTRLDPALVLAGA